MASRIGACRGREPQGDAFVSRGLRSQSEAHLDANNPFKCVLDTNGIYL